MPTLPKPGTEEYWQVKDDVRTLTRAQEIRADENRMGLALAMMEQEQKNISDAIEAIEGNKPLPANNGESGDPNPAAISTL